MAWEWVSPVVTGGVGVTAVIGTITAARISKATTRSVAEITIRAQREATYNERHYEVLRAALTYAQGGAGFVHGARLGINKGEDHVKMLSQIAEVSGGLGLLPDSALLSAFGAWSSTFATAVSKAIEHGTTDKDLEPYIEVMMGKQAAFTVMAKEFVNSPAGAVE